MAPSLQNHPTLSHLSSGTSVAVVSPLTRFSDKPSLSCFWEQEIRVGKWNKAPVTYCAGINKATLASMSIGPFWVRVSRRNLEGMTQIFQGVRGATDPGWVTGAVPSVHSELMFSFSAWCGPAPCYLWLGPCSDSAAPSRHPSCAAREDF